MDVDEVVLTDTANAKTFRMLSQSQLIEEVHGKQPDRKEPGDIYIINSEFQNPHTGNWEKIEIVVEKKHQDGKTIGVVITQKHRSHDF